MPTVFLSDAVGAERLAFGAAPAVPDAARRRWLALSALYRAGLEALGFAVRPILRPEIYQTGAARAALGVRPGDWHLAVKPTEHLRPFHGLPNVFACDWPHPALSHSDWGVSPFLDQARLLGTAEAVICPSAGTARHLRAAGIARARHLPPPVPARTGPAPGDDGTVVAVAEEWDDLAPLVRGFASARTVRDGLRLLLVTPAGSPLPAGVTIAVVEGPDPLPDGAAFLLSPAAPGRFSSSRLAAMRAGLPLISPLDEAGEDAPGPGCAVPLATRKEPVPEAVTPLARHLPLTRRRPTEEGVRDALLAAAALPPAERARMAEAARSAAEARFGLPAFAAGLREVLSLAGVPAP